MQGFGGPLHTKFDKESLMQIYNFKVGVSLQGKEISQYQFRRGTILTKIVTFHYTAKVLIQENK